MPALMVEFDKSQKVPEKPEQILKERNHIMSLPYPKTTTYGLHSFSYLASKIWNSLPDTYKTLNFLEFKQEILRYEAFPQ